MRGPTPLLRPCLSFPPTIYSEVLSLLNSKKVVRIQAGECARAKAAPLVYDRIVENVSNMSMCRNFKVTYKVKCLACDMKCSLGEGLHKDALGYARQSAQVST